jgi:hypothetical protein
VPDTLSMRGSSINNKKALEGVWFVARCAPLCRRIKEMPCEKDFDRKARGNAKVAKKISITKCDKDDEVSRTGVSAPHREERYGSCAPPSPVVFCCGSLPSRNRWW